MFLDTDTFLITVYCIVDDLYRERFAPSKPVRPGAKPEMTDSEVLTLTLLAQWDLHRSERWMLDYGDHHWRAYFPRLLKQSAFNTRVRDLAGVLCALGPAVSQRLAETLGLVPTYEVGDGVPVPLARRCRGERHRLFADDAAIGVGGADKEFYYGVKVFTVVNNLGLITGFVVGPATTDERFLAEALFRWREDPSAPVPTAAELATILGPSHRAGGQRMGPTGPLHGRLGAGEAETGVYVADLGLRGEVWQRHWWEEYGAAVLTKDAYADFETEARRQWAHWLSSLRQQVETTFSWLTSELGLKFPRARSIPGLLARLGAKIAAFNLAIYINHLYGRPIYSLFDPLR